MDKIVVDFTHFLVLVAGLEPARTLVRGILSPLRLPIPPHKHTFLHIYSVFSWSQDFKSLFFRAPEKAQGDFLGKGAAT